MLLAQALKRFYIRSGNKIVFKNKYTLNQLSLEMWEKLGYRSIDASVLSRVLKGERTFTPPQLETFCQVLTLTKQEKEDLKHALYQDYFVKYAVFMPPSFPSFKINYDILDLFDTLLNKCHDYLLQGKLYELKELTDLIDTYLSKILLTQKNATLRQKLYEQLGMNIHLQGKVVGGTALPRTVVRETSRLSDRLLQIAKRTKQGLFEAYANTLLANAYYVAGNYSLTKKGKSFYHRSIDLAKKAYANLPNEDHERLFALRIIAISAIYLQNKEDFLNIKRTLLNTLPEIPPETHFVNGINLYNTLAKGSAIFHIPSALKIKEIASNHFRITLEGRRIHEVAEIRNDLEMSLVLRMSDKNMLEVKINKALEVARKHEYIRHYKNIKSLAGKIL